LGGGHLDFGVIKDNIIFAVYEVKSQNYILGRDFVLNPALRAIWDHKRDIRSFVTRGGKEFPCSPMLEAYLVLLVGPNQDGIKEIGRQNLNHVLLFSDFLGEIDEQVCLKTIRRAVFTDVPNVIKILQRPTEGKRVTEEFRQIRQSLGDRPKS
jgi:hypothetical protein